jgi:hypothetical protein
LPELEAAVLAGAGVPIDGDALGFTGPKRDRLLAVVNREHRVADRPGSPNL